MVVEPLAAVLAASSKLGDLMLYSVIVILAILAMGIVLAWARRKCRAPSQVEPKEAFPLDALEGLRRDGAISEAEFKRLRQLALGIAEPQAGRGDSESSRPPEDDDQE